jgi:hypothetical protein
MMHGYLNVKYEGCTNFGLWEAIIAPLDITLDFYVLTDPWKIYMSFVIHFLRVC